MKGDFSRFSLSVCFPFSFPVTALLMCRGQALASGSELRRTAAEPAQGLPSFQTEVPPSIPSALTIFQHLLWECDCHRHQKQCGSSPCGHLGKLSYHPNNGRALGEGDSEKGEHLGERDALGMRSPGRFCDPPSAPWRPASLNLDIICEVPSLLLAFLIKLVTQVPC